MSKIQKINDVTVQFTWIYPSSVTFTLLHFIHQVTFWIQNITKCRFNDSGKIMEKKNIFKHLLANMIIIYYSTF